MKLTARQERFVAEYAVRRNGAAAAVAAGYAAGPSARVTASRLLTKANVQTALQAHQREAARLLGITREKVLLELQNAIEAARTKGEPATEIAGWREVSKLSGYYEVAPEVVRVSESGRRLAAAIRTLSDEEVATLAGVEL